MERSTGIDVFELVPPESLLDEKQQQSLLYSSDLELGETTRRIFEAFEHHQARSGGTSTAFRRSGLLAQGSLRYRRQILALKHFFAQRKATVLLLDDLTTDDDRQDRPQRRARRHPPRGVGAGIRRRPAAAAGHEISWLALQGRLSRFRDRDGRRAGIPAAGFGRTPQQVQARNPEDRQSSELNALLGGGVERGSSVPDTGSRGHRQVDSWPSRLPRTAVKSGRARGYIRLRRGTRSPYSSGRKDSE